MSQIEVIDLARLARLLPPAPGLCQKCATDHPEHYPHNQASLYWKYWFYNQEGRWPTWEDAWAHCTPELIEEWKRCMAEAGVKT